MFTCYWLFVFTLRARIIYLFTYLVNLACNLIEIFDDLLVSDLFTDPRDHLLHAALNLDPIMHFINLFLSILINLRDL